MVYGKCLRGYILISEKQLKTALKEANLTRKGLSELLGIGVSTTYWKVPPGWVFVFLEYYIENQKLKRFRESLKEVLE